MQFSVYLLMAYYDIVIVKTKFTNMRKLIIIMIALLSVTTTEAQTRKTHSQKTSSTSATKRPSTNKSLNVGSANRSQGAKPASDPRIIFSLPDDENTEEGYLSHMNTQLTKMEKYVEIDSPYTLSDSQNKVSYKLVYAVQKGKGIEIIFLCQSKTDIVSYIDEAIITQRGKEIKGKEQNLVRLIGESYKFKGCYYIIEYFFETNLLIQQIDELYIKCYNKDQFGNWDFPKATFKGIAVKENLGSEFLYDADGKSLEKYKSDNRNLLSKLGFDNVINETNIDGLNIKVKSAISAGGQLHVTVKFTNNTDNKKRIAYKDDNEPYVVTALGRVLKIQDPYGERNDGYYNIDIEGNSNQTCIFHFDGVGENPLFIQIFHLFDTQSDKRLLFRNIPVEEAARPHGKLMFGTSWSQAKDLGFVIDGLAGKCQYTKYENIDFTNCELGYKNGKLYKVDLSYDGNQAKNKFAALKKIFDSKYNPKPIDKCKSGYDHHDNVLVWIANGVIYIMNLHERVTDLFTPTHLSLYIEDKSIK